jgi:hypothetical protein
MAPWENQAVKLYKRALAIPGKKIVQLRNKNF